MRRRILVAVLIFAITSVVGGCAGFDRWAASFNAGTMGADWIVVQYRFDGTPINCWAMESTSIANEVSSDGIYWKDPRLGHLVHISGWYNRVQVDNKKFEEAATQVGVELSLCGNGKYPGDGFHIRNQQSK